MSTTSPPRETARSHELPARDKDSSRGEPIRGWLVRLAGHAWRHRGLTLLVVTASLLGTGLSAISPLLLSLGIDDAVSGRTDRINLLVVVMAAMAVIVFGGSFARQHLTARLALTVQHDLRTEVFGSLQRLDGAGQDEIRSGQVMARSNADLQMVQGWFAQVPQAFGSLVMLGIAFVAMILISPLLTLVNLASIVLAVLITLAAADRMSTATWAVQQRIASLSQRVTEAIAGAYVIRGFGQELRIAEAYTDEAERLFGERMRVARLQSWPSTALQSLPFLGQIAVLVLGGTMVIQGELSLGAYVAFAAYAGMMTSPASLLSNLLLATKLTRPSAERVLELIDLHPQVTDAPNARPAPAGPLGIALEEVTFGYAPDEPVLRDLTMVAEPGECLAIVGPSGSGKTTLALLMNRLYDPMSGAVKLLHDDTGQGHTTDLTEVELASLRTRVGVVYEDPFLFAGSIRDNITHGRDEVSEAEIQRVAELAGVASFIESLPDGYDSNVGERGSNLSGGQRQRIALARTLLASPSIIVMDDAVSAVDAATADSIHDNLREIAREHTLILIAHRRSSLSVAQRIIVLEDGQVVDSGTAQELQERCPAFIAAFGNKEVLEEVPTGSADDQANRLWPAVESFDPDARGDDEDIVQLDGMPVDRARARAVLRLPDADARPAPRLRTPIDEEPPPATLLDVLRPVRGLLLISLVLMSADSLVSALIPRFVQRGLDQGVAVGDFAEVQLTAITALVVISINAVLLFVQPRVITRTGESALFRIRTRTFRHTQRLDLEHFSREKRGNLLTVLANDVTALADFVESGVTMILMNVLTLCAMAGMMLIIDWQLALTAFAVLPVLVIATLVFRRFSKMAYEETRDRLGEVNTDLQESVDGIRVTQSSGTSDEANERFGSRSEKLRTTRLKAQTYAAAYFPFIGLLNEIAIIATLAVGMQRIVDGSLTAGSLTAFLLYLGMFFAPFQQLALVFDGYQRAEVGLGRIKRLLDTPPTITAPADPVRVDRRFVGELHCEAIDFTYAGAKEPALRGVNVMVPSGTQLAVVGSTGSGKSTLVKLLARLHDPRQGTIRIDGVDLRAFDPVELRQHYAVVPQDQQLFSGTIASNIRFAAPNASDAEVEQAAREVGALPTIAALPAGFATPVSGEQGGGLSTGQAQLVALARAQLVNPDVLLLDEPTASMDGRTERAVLAAMSRVAAGRTTVVVTHRLATAQQADSVLVLEHGEVRQHGPHETLLADVEGPYAALWESDQTSHYQDSGSSSTP